MLQHRMPTAAMGRWEAICVRLPFTMHGCPRIRNVRNCKYGDWYDVIDGSAIGTAERDGNLHSWCLFMPPLMCCQCVKLPVLLSL